MVELRKDAAYETIRAEYPVEVEAIETLLASLPATAPDVIPETIWVEPLDTYRSGPGFVLGFHFGDTNGACVIGHGFGAKGVKTRFHQILFCVRDSRKGTVQPQPSSVSATPSRI